VLWLVQASTSRDRREQEDVLVGCFAGCDSVRIWSFRDVTDTGAVPDR
jgi:hypothetical protein